MTRAAVSHFARNARLGAVALQAAIVLAVIVAILWLVRNIENNLERLGIAFGFDFLRQSARFPISESILEYSPSDSFGWAFVVGLGNTLFLALIAAAASTVLGMLLALARRSAHPLAYGLSSTVVEVFRNTPLVVQLLFWYAVGTVGLPKIEAAFNPVRHVYLSDRGLYLPALRFEATPLLWAILLAGIVATAVALRYRRQCRLRTGRPPRGSGMAVGGIVALTVACIYLFAGAGMRAELPARGAYNFIGGFGLTPEFVAVFTGLVLYTSAFVGEIIRGGIDAIAKGQWEAARALGLSERRALRLIILPQALRIIVPPLTSQYINVLKSTTLALVVGYPDLAFVAATTMNQTGQAIEAILILMLIFLLLSLVASAFMNWFNRRVALVER